MKKMIFAVGVGAMAVALTTNPAMAADQPNVKLAPLTTHGTAAVPGEYIVRTADNSDPAAVAKSMGVTPTYVYTATIKGFAAKMDPSKLNRARSASKVQSVSENAKLSVNAANSWGLDRIDQAKLPLDNEYKPVGTGKGVTAYVIDTGITPDLADFGGRASVGTDAIGDGQNGKDCHGHGTHVAGTVGGTKYGVAKEANLVGVRVLNCQGSGSTAQVVKGMDWVAANAKKPAVANMSLGGGKDATLNAAAEKLAGAGVFLAVAAGNEKTDACTKSPAGANGVFTTAASSKDDSSAARFTNFGKCVEAYAPGDAITSDWLDGSSKDLSGTSMASPHVAGIAALYKGSKGDADSATVGKWLQDNASKGAITGAPANTPADVVQTAGL